MLNTAGIIVIIIVLIALIVLIRNKTLDNFIVFLDDVVIPTSCYNYLVSNGKHYFLFNTKKITDNVSNPMKFNSKAEAISFLKNAKCPSNIPYVDLLSKKKNDDPTVSYQRECGTKIAPNLFELDACNIFGRDNNTTRSQYLSRINKIENDKKQYANYNLESCMIDKAITDDPKLDDANFRQYFANYFNRLNSNIDEKFLYINP